MAEDADQTQTEYKPGREFVYIDPQKLAMDIQNYFDSCDPHIIKKMKPAGMKDSGDTIWHTREVMTEQVPYTVTDLALALGVSRKTLHNYRKFEHYSNDIKPEVRIDLIHTIDKAIQKVEAFNERQLHRAGLSNGVKFNLTNNFGWIDKQVVETNTVDDDLDALDDPVADRLNVAEQAKETLASEEPRPETKE